MPEKLNFRYVKAESHAHFPVILVKDIQGFIHLTQIFHINLLFEFESRSEKSRVFFFPNDGILYQIDCGSYLTPEDYYYGVRGEFPDTADYYQAVEMGCEKYTEYCEMKKIGSCNREEFEHARRLGYTKGYDCFLEQRQRYRKQTRLGTIFDKIGNVVQLMQHAGAQGFRDYAEFETATEKGFPDARLYHDASAKGFQDSKEYFDAIRLGLSDAAEYHLAQLHHIVSKEEYDRYRWYHDHKPADISHDECDVLEFLSRQEHGSILKMEDIRNQMKQKWESLRVQLPGQKQAVIPIWFHRKLHRIADWSEFLSSKSVQEHGVYDTHQRQFEILRLSDKKIYIDGSNAAYGSESVPSYRTIHKIVEALRRKGFEDIIVITDASLKHKINDPQNLHQLKILTEYVETPSHTEADEFLIKCSRRDGCRVVTNDTFSDWKSRDRWVAWNIDRMRVPFVIVKNKITFSNLE